MRIIDSVLFCFLSYIDFWLNTPFMLTTKCDSRFFSQTWRKRMTYVVRKEVSQCYMCHNAMLSRRTAQTFVSVVILQVWQAELWPSVWTKCELLQRQIPRTEHPGEHEVSDTSCSLSCSLCVSGDPLPAH
jgi:hypothetical protein